MGLWVCISILLGERAEKTEMMHFTDKKIDSIEPQIKLGNQCFTKSCMFFGVKVDQNSIFGTHVL